MTNSDKDKLAVFLYNWLNILGLLITDMNKEVIDTIKREYNCDYKSFFDALEGWYLRGYLTDDNGVYEFTPIGYRYVKDIVERTGYDVNIKIT